MPQHVSQELLQQMSASTLAYAEKVRQNIDAQLENPDSEFYRNGYLGYAANLTDYLGGEVQFMDWYTRTFQGQDEKSITWQERYEAALHAYEAIERVRRQLHTGNR